MSEQHEDVTADEALEATETTNEADLGDGAKKLDDPNVISADAY